ncbi:MAG TPA: 5-deoxy-glucuronate isomerase [Actinomycetes bacterium]|jgi:5-deoxy-glucuronate isomerase|nr:5-deoxy-glucuronate isomerase [Actinomycetes bacterium]
MALTLHIDPANAGWSYCGLDVVELSPGESYRTGTGDAELLVLPLAGGPALVQADGSTLELSGRSSVFDRVTDFGYVPRDAVLTLTAPGGGRYALPSARCERRLPVRYGPAGGVPVELRGAGPASRQVTNFCAPDAFETVKLSAVEVLTPGGNWSSYPPHKHDTEDQGEAVLEEIYYFEVAGEHGFGYQRVYGHPGKAIDVLREVRTGDAVLVPHGYHGPSMAAPGYDLYYLNVLAGPAEQRTMAFRDDPAHAWIRKRWVDHPVDARLPMTTHVGRAER